MRFLFLEGSSACTDLAECEQTSIRLLAAAGNKASGKSPTPTFMFMSSQGLIIASLVQGGAYWTCGQYTTDSFQVQAPSNQIDLQVLVSALVLRISSILGSPATMYISASYDIQHGIMQIQRHSMLSATPGFDQHVLSTCHQIAQHQKGHSCCGGCGHLSCRGGALGPLLGSEQPLWHLPPPLAAAPHCAAPAVDSVPAHSAQGINAK